MKYLKLFETEQEFIEFKGGEGYVLPNVTFITELDDCHYEPSPIKPSEPDYSKEYLTFTALEDDMTVSFTKNASAGTLNYSIDEGNTWTELTDTTPSINRGEKIMFKGDLIPKIAKGIGIFSMTKQCDVSGNIMSLLYNDNFVGQTDLTGKKYAFNRLFRECATVINTKDLILPATTLANCCYDEMFKGCTSLTSVPELPATILKDNCYVAMFQDCISLTSAPELPATTLAESCYNGMFFGCTSLTTAPALPATKLVIYCYATMFAGCTSLTTAPALPASTLAENCYYRMFMKCTSLNYIKMLATDIPSSNYLSGWVSEVSSTGTFVKSAGVEIPTGTSGIPEGWTVVEE